MHVGCLIGVINDAAAADDDDDDGRQINAYSRRQGHSRSLKMAHDSRISLVVCNYHVPILHCCGYFTTFTVRACGHWPCTRVSTSTVIFIQFCLS